MKVSYRYLLNHIDLDGVSPKEIADKLTFAGAEVEEISPLASGTNLVIGEILSCIPHCAVKCHYRCNSTVYSLCTVFL